MAMTPQSWTDDGLNRKYLKMHADLAKLLGAAQRFIKWVEDTNGEVESIAFEFDGEQWTASVYVQQK